MVNIQLTSDQIESLTIDVLERAINSGHIDPLLISDGHVIGCEKAETPGGATPRESR